MCSKGSNTQTTTQSSSVAPNAAAMKAYKKVIGMADSAVATPYNAATEQQVAGFTDPTFQAFGQVQDTQGIADPFINQAQAFGMAGGAPITGETIQGYMNPYTDAVVDATQRDFAVQNDRQQSGVTGNARIAGSLGGDREAVAAALTAEAQSRSQAPIIANLRSQGYSTALGAAQTDAQRALVASGNMSNLGQAAQGAAYTDIGQLYQSGGMQQGLTQAELDAASANAAAQSAYPFQTAQWYAGIVNPTGANMGSTTTGSSTTQGPTPNTWSQAAGFGIAALPYLAKLADGGRVPQGFGGGYIPQVPIMSGGGLRPAPLMSSPSMMSADAGGGVAGSMDMASKGLSGLSDISKALRTTKSDGGWSTTVNPEGAQGWGNFLSNALGFAAGGEVPVGGGFSPSSLAGHMQDIIQAASALRAEMPMAIPHKAEGGEMSGFSWAGGLPMVPEYALTSAPSVEPPAMAGISVAPSAALQPYVESPRVARWSTTVEPAPSVGISRPVAAAAPAAPARMGFVEWLQSDDARNMLTPIGLSIMGQGAGGPGSFGLNFGRGASEGLKSYNEGENARKNREQQQRRVDMEAERLRLEAEKLSEESRMRGLEHPYRMQSLEADATLKRAQAASAGDGKIIEVGGQLVRIKPDGSTNVIFGSNPAEQRRKQIVDAGLDPEQPGNKVYIATGKMPREDQQPLSATDKKAILEADELVLASRNTIDGLERAKELSKKAYAGSVFGLPGTGADVRSAIGSTAPWATPEADATRELKNVVLSQALENLKATFGAAPTEGERKILLEIQGSVDQPQAVREAIYRRAQDLARIRLKFNEERAAQLRGGTYYGGTGGNAAKTPPASGGGIDKANVQQPKSGKPASEMTNEELLRSLQ